MDAGFFSRLLCGIKSPQSRKELLRNPHTSHGWGRRMDRFWRAFLGWFRIYRTLTPDRRTTTGVIVVFLHFYPRRGMKSYSIVVPIPQSWNFRQDVKNGPAFGYKFMCPHIWVFGWKSGSDRSSCIWRHK